MAEGLTVLAAVRAVTDVGPALMLAVVPALRASKTWLRPNATPIPGRETKALQVAAPAMGVLLLLQPPTPLQRTRVDVKAGLIPVR